MARKKVLTKEQKIEAEVKRLTHIFKNADSKKLDTVKGLIDECAFMRITLGELRAAIDQNGTIDEMPQGEYSIIRESPYVKTYHTMVQRYTTASEKLLGLLPKDERPLSDNDGFDSFTNERDEI